jgi:hypothetical protein
MKTFYRVLFSAALGLGAFGFVGSHAQAADKKEEMKCTKDGKSCKTGDDCKAENCKKKEEKK